MATESENIGHNPRLLDASEIGAILASARRSKEMSLQDLSDLLRIPKNYLKSLENSDFESLPGIAYVPGYIRSYCKATDIDSSVLIAAYFSSVDYMDVAPIYEVPGQALVPKFSKSSIAMFAVFAVIISYAGWLVILRDGPEQQVSMAPSLEQSPKIATSDDIASQAPLNSDNEEPIATAQLDTTEPTTSNLAIPSVDIAGLNTENIQAIDDKNSKIQAVEKELASQISSLEKQQQVPSTEIAPSSISEDVTIVGDTEPEIDVDTKMETSNPSSALAKEVELSDTITIRATASAWIEMVDSDGVVITSKLLRTGDSIAANLSDKLYLTTGNAGGLMFEMIDVPAFRVGKSGEIVRDLPLQLNSIISRKFD